MLKYQFYEGVFDMAAGVMEVYVGNPKCNQPVYVEKF